MSSVTGPHRAERIVTGNGFTHQDGETHLIISVCKDCKGRWFPPVAICANCAGTRLAQLPSGTDATVYASTVVRVGPHGFPPPYVLSYIDIDGVRLLVHTVGDDALEPGTPVRLECGDIGLDGDVALVSYRVATIPNVGEVRS